jgi:palmitoyltransferase
MPTDPDISTEQNSTASLPQMAATSQSYSPIGGRRSFVICGELFVFPAHTMDAVIHVGTIVVEYAVLVLGPLLITFAMAIIGGLSHTFFSVILPMLLQKYENIPGSFLIIGFHIAMVVFLVVEICFNYFMCVTTRNKGPNYDRVVRELAEATNFQYPETQQEVERFRREFDDKLTLRMQRRQSKAREEVQRSTDDETKNAEVNPEAANDSNSGVKKRKPQPSKKQIASSKVATNEKIRSWMMMAPDEWGYCNRSNQPKPPRAHYDHVSKTLVLCLDHYCPWMFNVVGYFNYRYFCNFLWFVQLGMIYGGCITYESFMNTGGRLYRMQRDQLRKTGIRKRLFPMVPFPDERLKISLACMLCLSIGLAVACLGGFHLYLCLTGQTTIEFHGNWMNRRKAKRLNKKWKNPYDMGLKRNWQQVYGSGNALRAFLIPSKREPEFFPIPIPGEDGRRKWCRKKYEKTLLQDETNGSETKGDTLV